MNARISEGLPKARAIGHPLIASIVAHFGVKSSPDSRSEGSECWASAQESHPRF